MNKEIIILDDVFPQFLSAWRFSEYHAYLNHFPNLKIYTKALDSPKSLGTLGVDKKIEDYWERFPEYKNRIFPFKDLNKLTNPKLFYSLFLNNTISFLGLYENYNCPFAFTLYPGGGFYFNSRPCDESLKRIFNSLLFKKVIVTQKPVKDYLLANRLCPEHKIAFIYGGFESPEIYTGESLIKREEEINIMFMGAKYTPGGFNKGYDIFIESAKEIAKKHNKVRFHVIGNFDQADVPIEGLISKITFYGLQEYTFMKSFYPKMDIIISPHRANAFAMGSFDGFPGGLDAGVGGVAVFTTDPSNQNFLFKDREDLVIIDHNPINIAKAVGEYIDFPEGLLSLRNKNREKFHMLFSSEVQSKPRIDILENVFAEYYL